MMKSMTAFGRARMSFENRDIIAEIKSVNSGYLDCTAKLPKDLSFLEEKIKPYLKEKGLSRGKVDVYISTEATSGGSYEIRVDEELAGKYINALKALRDRFDLPDGGSINVMSIARMPDVFTTVKPEEDAERDWNEVRAVLDAALEGFMSASMREGANIERDLAAKIETIKNIVAKIEVLSAGNTSGYMTKLEERIRKLLDDENIRADEARLLTECAIFADKIAIDEEIVRLRSHFDAFGAIAKSGEPAGRKIDFLMQEMNREINTIGSKSCDAEIAHLVVDVKTELEKIREQIQNIE